MNWLQWMLVATAAASTPVVMGQQNGDPCPWLESINDTCVRDMDCGVSGTNIEIWEDCASGSTLFTVKNESILVLRGCDFLSNSTATVKLAREVNAEVDNIIPLSCYLTTEEFFAFFPILDVNEERPEPVDGNRVTEVTVKENGELGVTIASFEYQDGDYKETITLTAELISVEFKDLFSISQYVDKDNATFTVESIKALDFEARTSYKLEINIASFDERGTMLNSTHTVLVWVEDVGDMPPYWVETAYTTEFLEGDANRNVFKVSAEDRDVTINNEIHYNITKGNEAAFFEIDVLTGEVTNLKLIDREELAKEGITFFSLEITAQEYDATGKPAPKPSSSTTTANVYIADVNNKIPSFNKEKYEIVIDELTDQNTPLIIEIFVFDMDEGINGQFNITSDYPDDLTIQPSVSQLNATLSLTAVYRSDTIFDYDANQDPIEITLTATEKKNQTHRSTAILTITLNDKNDNYPIFTEEIYEKDVNETAHRGYVVTSVAANDHDFSEKYGNKSIRYFLSSCPALDVNTMTGEVILALDNSLDYEENKNLSCIVEAHDNNDMIPRLVGYSTLVINVLDVVDSPPTLTGLPPDMKIKENSGKGTQLPPPITALDKDENANITFSIDWTNSIAKLGSLSVNISLVQKWFVMGSASKNPENYTSFVTVGNESPDREVADFVSLFIEVIDLNTEANKDRDSGLLPITILDENDCFPEFDESYDHFEIKENEQGGFFIGMLQASDQDLDDSVTFNISDNSLVEVIQDKKQPFSAKLQVSEGAIIDREKMEQISVNITVKDSVDHETILEVNITINDVNDNPPIMEEGVCNQIYNISEVSGLELYENTNTENGTLVWNFTASDADVGVEHSTVTYVLVNEQQPGIKDRHLPFKMNSTTGELTVFLDPSLGKLLDREDFQGDYWDLVVVAYDFCAEGEVVCKPKESEPCGLYINVMDVNDQSPTDFEWTSYPDDITVDEFLIAGETAVILGSSNAYEILANDEDEAGTDNTKLNYTVLSVTKTGDSENLGLLEAINEKRPIAGGVIQYYCKLSATKNFTHLKGNYEILIMAEDFGIPPLNGTAVIPLTIKDANDNTPTFHYYSCLNDTERIITMAENYYAKDEVVMCKTPDADPHPERTDIRVIDDDDGDNKKVTVFVDYGNTTVEPSSVGEGQMRNFKIRVVSGSEDKYEIFVSDSIDKEKGSIYNLSLHVIDQGKPPLESWSWVKVIVTNVFESPPYFCFNEQYCTQTIYMNESDPKAWAEFDNATDPDDVGVDPSDVNNYDPVYYEIVGGSTGDFRLLSRNETVLQVAEELDRETTDQYSLYIDTFNGGGGGEHIDDPVPRNYTLYLSIIVLDVNDNPPEFPKPIVLGSLMENDQIGHTVAVVEADDKDLEEILTYSLGTDFEWVDGPNPPPKTPFTIKQQANNTAAVVLNFDPTGVNKGYCTFTVLCTDNDALHTGKTQAKIYAITVNYLLPVYFENAQHEVQSAKDDIEIIFSEVYGYLCSIDSIVDSDLKNADLSITVKMHFIDEGKDILVPKEEILDATEDDRIVAQLYSRLNALNLNLQSIGDQNIDIGDGGGLVLVLEVLLAIVAFVLSSLVILLITAYFVRTRKLERQVKVLSTNTFGSRSSQLNHIGTEMTGIPGSNKFLGEGSNPLYNLSDVDMQNDSESIDSGDSVLVGVEENAQFGHLKAPQNDDRLDGFSNPAFSRSIDSVSAPIAFSGGTRINPLLEMGHISEEDGAVGDAMGNNVLYLDGSSDCGEAAGSTSHFGNDVYF